MSPASKSKSKDKKSAKEPQKASTKVIGVGNTGGGIPVSGYNPHLGKFHTLETAPLSSASPLQVNSRFRNIDETDDQSGTSKGTALDYDTVSNNGSWSGESEDHKDKGSANPPRHEVIPGSDNDKREKIRQKNERKHQRQKEKRAQELHERCSGFLMSRKLESLAQQLVQMGFSTERATMALIVNEGKIEESVAWLFEGGEEAGKSKGHNYDGGNLKIDISEELARIADMEIRYNCSKQEVERVIVACEGDLEKTAESLRTQKQEPPTSSPQKLEETGDPPTASNKLPVVVNQNPLRVQPKANQFTLVQQQRRDEKDFNYTKTAAVVGAPVEPGNKNVQALRKAQPAKPDWSKPQQVPVPVPVPADKRWSSAASNPAVSFSLASSPLQATLPHAKPDTRYAALGNELKNLQLGSVKEPVVVMQRPQSANAKHGPSTSISSSPPLPPAASSWYPTNGEMVKPNGYMQQQHIPTSKGTALNTLNSNQLYNQFHQNQQQQQQQQFVPNNGVTDSVGASGNRGNVMWNRMGTSPTLAAASSLGLFSGLGSNGSSGASSPVDWNTGGSMLHLDYANIDWSLDLGSTASRATSGLWQGGMGGSVMQNNSHHHHHHMYEPSYSSSTGMNGRTAMMRPAMMGNGNGVQLAGLQEGGVGSVEMSAPTGGSREWSSPFEEKDIFSLPRQFVSSPSL